MSTVSRVEARSSIHGTTTVLTNTAATMPIAIPTRLASRGRVIAQMRLVSSAAASPAAWRGAVASTIVHGSHDAGVSPPAPAIIG